MPEQTPIIPGESTKGWLDSLQEIERFSGEHMIHRTNDLLHALRTGGIALIVAKAYSASGNEVNADFIKKVRRMAHQHDDPETDPEIGDIPSPVKRSMTSEQKGKLRRKEEEATRKFSSLFVEPGDQQIYLEEAEEIREEQTPEAQIVDLADKIDGLCETLHEIRCGNENFYPILENYRKTFEEDLSKYPIFKIAVNDPDIQLHVPTPEEARAMSKISPDILQEKDGWEKFWTVAFDPKLPAFYRYWMRLTDSERLYTPPSTIFSGWQKELDKAYEKKQRL